MSTDPIRDEGGNTGNQQDGSKPSLEFALDHLQGSGRAAFDRDYIFLNDVPKSEYSRLSKSAHPNPKHKTRKGPSPWPEDPEGRVHPCNEEGLHAFTLPFRERVLISGRDQPQWIEDHVHRVVICPRSFIGDKKRPRWEEAIDTSLQKEGKLLDSFSVGALTFYHELFHLQAMFWEPIGLAGAPDAFVRRRKCQRDSNDKCLRPPRQNE